MKIASFCLALLLVPALGLIAVSPARAQVVTYTFDSSDIHADSVAAASVDPNATASAISRTNLANGASNININGYFEVGGDGNFNNTNSYNTSDYVSFTVTPDAGYDLTFAPSDTLTFNVGIQDASETAQGGIDVQYSNDGFSTSTDLGSTAVTAFFGQSVSLSLDSLPSASSASGGQFRFYFDGASNPYETGMLGDIVVNATVGSVPEPGSSALMLGGVLALALFIRRRMTA